MTVDTRSNKIHASTGTFFIVFALIAEAGSRNVLQNTVVLSLVIYSARKINIFLTLSCYAKPKKEEEGKKSWEILLSWNELRNLRKPVPGHRIRTIFQQFSNKNVTLHKSDKLSLAAQIVHVDVGGLMYTNRNLIYRLPSLTHRTSPYPIVNYPKDNFLGCYKYTSIFQSLRNIFKHLHPSSESKSNFKQVAQTLNKKKKKRTSSFSLSFWSMFKKRKKKVFHCVY